MDFAVTQSVWNVDLDRIMTVVLSEKFQNDWTKLAVMDERYIAIFELKVIFGGISCIETFSESNFIWPHVTPTDQIVLTVQIAHAQEFDRRTNVRHC